MPSFFSTLLRTSNKRRAYADLLQLDDRMLRDIGVTRSDLRLMMNGSPAARAQGQRSHE
jgi:uncharacterized protein YjiS (DUF1127 family)